MLRSCLLLTEDLDYHKDIHFLGLKTSGGLLIQTQQEMPMLTPLQALRLIFLTI